MDVEPATPPGMENIEMILSWILWGAGLVLFMYFIFGHTSDMYAADEREELCSSPASMRNGLPLTMSCAEFLVRRR